MGCIESVTFTFPEPPQLNAAFEASRRRGPHRAQPVRRGRRKVHHQTAAGDERSAREIPSAQPAGVAAPVTPANRCEFPSAPPPGPLVGQNSGNAGSPLNAAAHVGPVGLLSSDDAGGATPASNARTEQFLPHVPRGIAMRRSDPIAAETSACTSPGTTTPPAGHGAPSLQPGPATSAAASQGVFPSHPAEKRGPQTLLLPEADPPAKVVAVAGVNPLSAAAAAEGDGAGAGKAAAASSPIGVASASITDNRAGMAQPHQHHMTIGARPRLAVSFTATSGPLTAAAASSPRESALAYQQHQPQHSSATSHNGSMGRGSRTQRLAGFSRTGGLSEDEPSPIVMVVGGVPGGIATETNGHGGLHRSLNSGSGLSAPPVVPRPRVSPAVIASPAPQDVTVAEGSSHRSVHATHTRAAVSAGQPPVSSAHSPTGRSSGGGSFHTHVHGMRAALHLQMPSAGMSRTKLTAVRRWVDAGDHGDTGLGPLLDPQDVEGHRNREWRRAGLAASVAAPSTVAAAEDLALQISVRKDAASPLDSKDAKIAAHTG